MRPGTEKGQGNDPLPGFLKTEPTFNMDYSPAQEREDFEPQQPYFGPPPSSSGGYKNHQEDVPGQVTLRLSYSGVISILFALLLLGVLFFLSGFLSGMFMTEYASQTKLNSGVKNMETPSVDLGDENV